MDLKAVEEDGRLRGVQDKNGKKSSRRRLQTAGRITVLMFKCVLSVDDVLIKYYFTALQKQFLLFITTDANREKLTQLTHKRCSGSLIVHQTAPRSGSSIAHQPSGAEVPSSYLASSTMILKRCRIIVKYVMQEISGQRGKSTPEAKKGSLNKRM